MSRIPRPELLANELRAAFCTSLPRVTVAVMASGTGHGVAICTSLSHVHPTGTVAVMASCTGAWGGDLYITVPCPPNQYSCCHGIRYVDMGRRSVHHRPMSTQPDILRNSLFFFSEPQVTRDTISSSLKTSQHSNAESSLIHCSTASTSTEQSNWSLTERVQYNRKG
ncbi:hypothetical protein AVEN_163439-1 [Araneus ventricosus]|uniref:Uncharacterized protein n=1 Tax=Araneus ventricosus TaxID=182803 RepID=A0A4Y2VJ50_ARAVE|nr:hypothetical protein AVEN_163439-1 [Araneus ventricosus]